MIDRLRKWAILTVLATASGCSSGSTAPAAGTTATPTASGAPLATTAPSSAPALTAAAATPASSGSPAAASPTDFIDAMAWAPAGDRIAVWCGAACSRPGTGPLSFQLVDLPAGTTRTATIVDPDGNGVLRGVSFSDKGTFTVAAAGNRIVVLKTADLSQVFNTDKLAVYGVMGVSPDETHFALADAFGFGEITDLATGKNVGRASLHDPASGNNQQMEWLPSGARVVFGCVEECTPELWGTKGKRIAKLSVDGAPWTSSELLVTPDGAVVVAAADGMVALFDGTDGKGAVLRKKLAKPGELGRVAIALSADGKKLVVGRSGGDLTVFDLATKKATPVLVARDGAAPIETVRTSPDGARIAFGDSTTWYEVRAVEKAAPEKLDGLVEGYGESGALVVRKGDSIVALVEGKERWRAAAPSVAGAPGEPKSPAALAFSHDRKVVAIADGKLHLVRVADGKTATLGLDSKSGTLALMPLPGTTAADVAAVLGK